MATFSRDSFASAARRGANGRFTSTREQLRRSTLWGSRAASKHPLPPR